MLAVIMLNDRPDGHAQFAKYYLNNAVVDVDSFDAKQRLFVK